MSINLKIINCSKIIRSVRLAVTGLYSNRTRTSLSVLGIVIGVAAVIMIVSVGQGLQAFILGQLNAFGTDIVSVQPKIPGESYENSAMSMGEGVILDFLDSEDAESLRDENRFPYITAASGYTSDQRWTFYEDKEEQVLIVASDSYYPKIDAMLVVEEGIFFTEEENRTAAKVVVIGSAVAEDFFPNGNWLGKNIKLENENFQVIGVMKERGSILGFDMDKLLVIPLRTSELYVKKTDYVQEIGIKLKSDEYLSQAKFEIASLMRENHKIEKPEDDDFQIITMDEMLTTIGSITGAISALLGLLAAISLVVGGIGIMNIMFVIVAERTKEIGLRKALGARYRDIMNQFVFEAVFISLLGGFMGILIGIVVSFIMTQIIVSYANLDWPFVVSYYAIAISFAVAIIFGIIFGWYPAKKAAKMNPIDALRR